MSQTVLHCTEIYFLLKLELIFWFQIIQYCIVQSYRSKIVDNHTIKCHPDYDWFSLKSDSLYRLREFLISTIASGLLVRDTFIHLKCIAWIYVFLWGILFAISTLKSSIHIKLNWIKLSVVGKAMVKKAPNQCLHRCLCVCVCRQYETVVPLEDPIVTEVTSTLQEWAVLWKQLYVVSLDLAYSY